MVTCVVVIILLLISVVMYGKWLLCCPNFPYRCHQFKKPCFTASQSVQFLKMQEILDQLKCGQILKTISQLISQEVSYSFRYLLIQWKPAVRIRFTYVYFDKRHIKVSIWYIRIKGSPLGCIALNCKFIRLYVEPILQI